MFEDILYLAFLAIIARLIYDSAAPDDDSEEEISACIRCGSKDLNYSSQGLGIHNPNGAGPTFTSCNTCGFIGPPVILISEKTYQIFLENLQKPPEDESKEKTVTAETGQNIEESIYSTPEGGV